MVRSRFLCRSNGISWGLQAAQKFAGTVRKTGAYPHNFMALIPAITSRTAVIRAMVSFSFRHTTPSNTPKTTELSRRAATREMGACDIPHRENP